MHGASWVIAAGADFTLMGPNRTALPSRSRCSASARSAPGRARARRRPTWWASSGRGAAGRGDPPPDALRRPREQRSTLREFADLATEHTHHRGARGVRAPHRRGPGDLRRRRLRRHPRAGGGEADVILGTAGTTTCPSTGRPHSWSSTASRRPRARYHPGEANLRMADAIIINKVDSASPEQLETLRREYRGGEPASDRSPGTFRASRPMATSPGRRVAGRRGRTDPDARRDDVRGRHRGRPA